jgi:hypothetical protein
MGLTTENKGASTYSKTQECFTKAVSPTHVHFILLFHSTLRKHEQKISCESGGHVTELNFSSSKTLVEHFEKWVCVSVIPSQYPPSVKMKKIANALKLKGGTQCTSSFQQLISGMRHSWGIISFL